MNNDLRQCDQPIQIPKKCTNSYGSSKRNMKTILPNGHGLLLVNNSKAECNSDSDQHCENHSAQYDNGIEFTSDPNNLSNKRKIHSNHIKLQINRTNNPAQIRNKEMKQPTIRKSCVNSNDRLDKRYKKRAISFSDYKSTHHHPQSPARNKIDPFYFTSINHQSPLTIQPDDIDLSHVFEGFNFLECSRESLNISSEIRSEYGQWIEINSRYSLSLYPVRWPKQICETYSETALCPSELEFSAMIVARDNFNSCYYKIIPTSDVWVTAKLLGRDRTSINDVVIGSRGDNMDIPDDYDENTAAISNDPHGTIRFLDREKCVWEIIDHHPVFPGQKPLVMINKSSIQKRSSHGAKLKDIICGDCRSELVDKTTGIVTFSGLNITIPEVLPKTSIHYPAGTSEIHWDYVYKLIFYARINLPFSRNRSILLGAVTDRIITGHTRHTIKTRKTLPVG